jgi:hypothetical protein
LVAVDLLVVVVVAVATSLGLSPGAGLALPLVAWGVPGTALHSPGALVHEAEERRNILDVMGGELL